MIFLGVGSALYLRSTRTQSQTSLTTKESSDGSRRLSSFYQNAADYETAFATANSATPKTEQVTAAITSHHFLAKSLIARTLTGINPTKVKNILLISPDHFNAISSANTLGVTTNDNWDTPFGAMDANFAQIEALTTLSGVTLQPKLFLSEHGIYTLIPFIKKQFPDAKVVPLVLKNSDNFAKYEQLGKDLHQVFAAEDTLVLISSDFTHDQTVEKATELDLKSIQALTTHTQNDVSQIDSDCQVCMATLFGYLSVTPSTFQLVENKNSFNFSGEDRDRVTSYVSGYYVPTVNHDQEQQALQLFLPPGPNPSPRSLPTNGQTANEIKLLFGGDLMFDRNIRLKMKAFGNDHILKELDTLFHEQSIVIANLEGPITDNPSRSVGSAIGSTSNYIFTFDPSITKTLFDANIHLVNLGNNHIENFGKDGVKQTKTYLEDQKIGFFGDTGNEQSSNDRTYRIERSGISLGFVNYNQFTTDGLEHALSDIRAVRPTVDLLFVYTHWGNEYVPKANEVIQKQAHSFIDEGADVIIGSHPHVIQNVEEYKGKKIYYSLGNFVFDQYFSSETQKGLLVGITINPLTKAMNFTEYTVQLKTNGQTVPVASP